ncbi:MAG: hypothetical protein HY303_20390 [Candidatus Wallbacteria bacterium]|nr:hypothetical protein [Candidatus Wallbacteria bacterium]
MAYGLAFLSFLSGTCGIAYEVLYARLLTTYLGDMFHVAGAILASFLLWLGIGSLAAHRWRRHLWVMEGLIGLYALAMALLSTSCKDWLLGLLAPMASGSPVLTVLIVFAIVAVPAGLAGFSVPLFTLYLEASSSGARRGFDVVYVAYNLGAAVFILSVEFWLLPSLGIAGSLSAMGAINLLIGAALLATGAGESGWGLEKHQAAPMQPAGRRALAVLVAVSAASGVYQLLFLKVSKSLFGPYHENFALVIAVGLIGIAAATAALARVPVPLARVLLVGGGAIAGALLLLGPELHLWGTLNDRLSQSTAVTRTLKVATLLLIGGVPLGVFGATVPAILKDFAAGGLAPGLALGLSSFGNCAGYLATTFYLHDRFTPHELAMGVVAFTIAGGFALGGRALGPLVLLAALAFVWPSDLLELGYTSLRSPGVLKKRLERLAATTTYKKFGQSLSIVTDRDGRETLVIEGYQALIVSPGQRANIREILFGMTPALFTRRRDSALVLGVGTGLTAGTVSSLYDRVKAVDIHPAVFELLERYGSINNDLLHNPHTKLVLEDALGSLAGEGPSYDAIVNTVTSPLFFSSCKLYTRDFFELVKHRLAPGGVYAFWFDKAVTRQGAKIVFQTVKQSFRYCDLLYLSKGYTQVLCSQEPLAVRTAAPDVWSRYVRDRLGAHKIALSPTDLLLSLLLPGDTVHGIDWGEPVNTFDRPALEFVMAPRAINDELRFFVLYSVLGLDLETAWVGQGPPAADRLERRAYAFRLLDSHDLIAALRSRNGGLVTAGFVDLILPFLASGEADAKEIAGYAWDMWKQGEHARMQAVLARLQPGVRARLSPPDRPGGAWMPLGRLQALAAGPAK